MTFFWNFLLTLCKEFLIFWALLNKGHVTDFIDECIWFVRFDQEMAEYIMLIKTVTDLQKKMAWYPPPPFKIQSTKTPLKNEHTFCAYVCMDFSYS